MAGKPFSFFLFSFCPSLTINPATNTHTHAHFPPSCSRAYPLKHLLEKGLQTALEGKGRRVFEAWIISDEAAVNLMKMGLLQPFTPQ